MALVIPVVFHGFGDLMHQCNGSLDACLNTPVNVFRKDVEERLPDGGDW